MPRPVARVAHRSEVSARTAISSAALPMTASTRPSGNQPSVYACAIVPASEYTAPTRKASSHVPARESHLERIRRVYPRRSGRPAEQAQHGRDERGGQHDDEEGGAHAASSAPATITAGTRASTTIAMPSPSVCTATRAPSRATVSRSRCGRGAARRASAGA